MSQEELLRKIEGHLNMIENLLTASLIGALSIFVVYIFLFMAGII